MIEREFVSLNFQVCIQIFLSNTIESKSKRQKIIMDTLNNNIKCSGFCFITRKGYESFFKLSTIPKKRHIYTNFSGTFAMEQKTQDRFLRLLQIQRLLKLRYFCSCTQVIPQDERARESWKWIRVGNQKYSCLFRVRSLDDMRYPRRRRI